MSGRRTVTDPLGRFLPLDERMALRAPIEVASPFPNIAYTSQDYFDLIGMTRTSHDVRSCAAVRLIADIKCARSERPYYSGFWTARFIDSGLAASPLVPSRTSRRSGWVVHHAAFIRQ